jgi:predicted RNA-binding protein YlxR (DUF448 family)
MSRAPADQARVGGNQVTPIAKTRHIPERTCVACGRKIAKAELVRIVRTPDGPMVVDETGRQNGRGAYMCRQAQCWEKALTRRVLERGLRGPVASKDLSALQQYFIETFASAAASQDPTAAGGASSGTQPC